MNLQLLQQLDYDFNGSVVRLLELAISGERLCFYDKGTTFAKGSSEDWETDEDNRYTEYAWETETPCFYSMFGEADLGYEFEVSQFSDGRADEASDTGEFTKSQLLKSNWVLAPVIIRAIPELFPNLKQDGERNPDNAGTFYHELGIYWETQTSPLEVDLGVAASVLQCLKLGEDSLPKNVRQAAAMGLPTRLFV